ncbi:E3 ubiquitin-protein ligase [Arachis hypogaea]|nr:E3 ubiquitin-protein ligase [Arachis hypogaea]
MALSIDGNNHNTNNEDPKVEMMKPQKNGVELPFCGRCCDFKLTWEMFKILKCGHNFCRFCMHEYVASCLRDNIIMVPCPDPKCKVKYGPEYFCSLLPFEVFKRWQKVIKDCNTPILDKQLDKNPIHVADDEENNDVKEDATILSSSLISLGVAHSSRTQLSPSLVSGLPHCLRTGTQARRCSLGSGLSHGLWSPTQSRSLAFPAIVITDGRSSRSRDWSSSSLPVSHRLAVSPAPSLRSSLPAEEAAGPGASPRCQQLSPSASFAQPEASPDLELAAVQLSFRFMTLEMDLAILVMKCPEPKCKGILEPQNCISIIPKEVFERWENALCENLVLATSKKFYCPFKDCSAMLVNDDGNEVVTCPECPHCHRLFCAQCKVAWHGGMKCGEFMSLNENEREKEDLMVMNLAKAKRWRRCSKCRIYVEKNEGCSHISCRCGHHFCYVCGKPWNKYHGCI